MKKKIFIFIYCLTPIFLTLVIYQANPDRYRSLWSISSMSFGTVAYAWTQWQFILSSRPKWLEKGIGMDYIYRFHGLMALVTIGLGFVHGQLKERIYPDNLMTNLGSGALIIFGGVSILSILVMVNSKLHSIKLVNHMKVRLQKFKWLRYEQLKKFHNLTVVGLVMVVVHVLMTNQVKQSFMSFSIYMGLFIIAFGHYLFHKIYRTWLVMEQPLEVESIEKAALDQSEKPPYMWHIHMKSKKGRIHYKPGQFAFFKFLHNGKLEEHPFSIASTPTEASLTISVKQLGDFTSHMGGIEVGSLLVMDGPYGAFSYKLHKKEDGIVFFVAGIGITPAMGMIRHMKALNEHRSIMVVWQINSIDEGVFLSELSTYEKEMEDLKIDVFVGATDSAIILDPSINLHHGRIKGSYIHQLVEESRVPKNANGYYICGPLGYMNLVKAHLVGAGVKKRHIHSESFSF